MNVTKLLKEFEKEIEPIMKCKSFKIKVIEKKHKNFNIPVFNSHKTCTYICL
jgi:hypothetical protein